MADASDQLKYITDNLVEFETIIDIDIPIIMLMIQQIKNKDILNPDIFGTDTMSGIKNLLLFRPLPNPLSAILKKKYFDSLDTILDEFKDKNYDDILDMARPTDLFQLIVNFEHAGGAVKNTIVCDDQSQEKIIQKYNDQLKTVVDDRNMNSHNCLFIKYIKNIDRYIPLTSKHIFVINAAYNLDKVYAPLPISIILGQTNIVRTIDPYKNLTVPNASMEEIINEQKRKQSDGDQVSGKI